MRGSVFLLSDGYRIAAGLVLAATFYSDGAIIFSYFEGILPRPWTNNFISLRFSIRLSAFDTFARFEVDFISNPHFSNASRICMLVNGIDP